MSGEFKYVPFADPLLKQVREHLKGQPIGQQLPPEKIACVDCPNAAWMWVEKTDAGRKRAMSGFADKAGWRCECHAHSMKPTYDSFASTVEPECWVMACNDRVKAIMADELRQRKEWSARGGHNADSEETD